MTKKNELQTEQQEDIVFKLKSSKKIIPVSNRYFKNSTKSDTITLNQPPTITHQPINPQLSTINPSTHQPSTLNMASTLRLSPHHEDQLTEISKLVGTKSKNETIQKMIETYSQLKAELEKTQKLLSHTLREKHDITQKVQNFQTALEQLNTL